MRFSLCCCLLFSSLYAAASYEEPWGQDVQVRYPSEDKDPIRREESLAVNVAKKIILFHQRVISPVDGPRSHFYPCSSRYMKMAMTEHGFIKGFLMGCDRLLRENKDPWVYRNIIIDHKLVKYDPPKNR